MAKLTKQQLEMFNEKLDTTCQELQEEVKGLRKESEILKGIISLMMMGGDTEEKIIKLVTPDPLYIKIENDFCTIIRENKEKSIN